jgi:predicted acylesterase/phospholipase RssA
MESVAYDVVVEEVLFPEAEGKISTPPTQIDFDSIVLSGGSIKGLVILGALQYAYDSFLLKDVKVYVGTSSGAMIGYLLAIGYTPTEIIVWICTHQLLEKMHNFNFVGMLQGVGASSFNNIQEQLEKMTMSKIADFITLGDLKERFGKTLICPTYNVTTKTIEYLTPETHPKVPCITAVRMSSNLPLVFENFKYRNNFYVDGALADNFPVQIAEARGNRVLGILLNQNSEEKSDPNSDMLEFIYGLLMVPVSQAMEYKIANACPEKCRIVRLDYPKVKFFSFNMTTTQKLDMFSEGYNQIRSSFS